MKYCHSVFLGLTLFITACQDSTTPPANQSIDAETAAENSSDKPQTLVALVETASPAPGTNEQAVLWQTASGSERAWLLATNPKQGLQWFDLNGAAAGTAIVGSFESIDIRHRAQLATQRLSVISTADRQNRQLFLAALSEANGQPTLQILNTEPVSLGYRPGSLCLYQSASTGHLFTFVSDENGRVQQWQWLAQGNGARATLVREFAVGGELSACVVDDERSMLFVAEEAVGIWALPAEPEAPISRTPVDIVAPFGHIDEVKALTLVAGDKGSGYLLAMRDGDGSLQAYARDDYRSLFRWKIESDKSNKNVSIDSVDQSSALHAAPYALGTRFPTGVLLVQDDNDDHHGGARNLKLISLTDLAKPHGMPAVASRDAYATLATGVPTVTADVETTPVETDGDAADDPAIWVNVDAPDQSLIVATQKQSGLTVYSLDGRLLQHRKDGLMNNVDLRAGFAFRDKPGVIVAASKRDDDSIALYRLDTNKRELIPVSAGVQLANLAEIYGLCIGHDAKQNAHYVYLTSKTGELKQFRLRATGVDEVVAEPVRSFRFASQIEGCVVDDETGTLYVGEEDVGLWRADARETGGETKTLVEPVGQRLIADVEGLAIWHGANGKGYLVVSSQGDDRYALFERTGNNAYVGDFRIVADTASGIDGASETDGLEVTSMPLGSRYPQGVLIVQDGRNVSPQDNQNFKLVSWQRISDALLLPEN